MIRFYLIFAVVFALGVPAWAQNADRNKPLEITADESLEWNRTDLYFKARKNVKATQGKTSLFTALLTAKYRDGKEGGIDIYTIKADGAVRIVSENSQAYGDHAVYDVDTSYAVMTGDHLRLVSDDQVVTARDKFEYYVSAGRLEAHGQAKAEREGDMLEADKMIALFEQDSKTGRRVLKSLEAIGNVVITTPDEILTGNRAIYSAQTNVAELLEGVVIVRGPNKLQGTRAEVNLETNISKIYGGTPAEGGRVRGVFYPSSAKKPE